METQETWSNQPPLPVADHSPPNRKKLTGHEKLIVFGVSGAVVLAMLIGGIFFAGILFGKFGEDLNTPSGVAKAYMSAMERGDMERALELTSFDSLEDVGRVSAMASPVKRISNFKIEGESYESGENGSAWAVVSISYHLDETPHRGKLLVDYVFLDGQETNRVRTPPLVVDKGGANTDLVRVEVGGQTGAALLPLGQYEVDVTFQNQYLANPTCVGIMTVSLSMEGKIESETDPDDRCITGKIHQQEISESSLAEIDQIVQSAVKNCAVACNAGDFGTVPDGDVKTAADTGCEVTNNLVWGVPNVSYQCRDSNGWLKRYDPGEVASLEAVDFFRLDASQAIEVRPSMTTADRLILSLASERCAAICGEPAAWSKQVYEPMTFQIEQGAISVSEEHWPDW